MEFSDGLWRKSSYSSETADCVEINFAALSPTVGIRDSKNPAVGVLRADLAGLLAFAKRDTR